MISITEDQQALEDEGIVIPMIKPSIPAPAPPRNQSHHNLLSSSSGSHHSNAIVPLSNNPAYSAYSQNPYGNSAGHLTANYSSSNLVGSDSTGRRKSIIDSIHPAISETKQLPYDLLSAFPVSDPYPFFYKMPLHLHFANLQKKINFFFCDYRRICYMFVYRN